MHRKCTSLLLNTLDQQPWHRADVALHLATSIWCQSPGLMMPIGYYGYWVGHHALACQHWCVAAGAAAPAAALRVGYQQLGVRSGGHAHAPICMHAAMRVMWDGPPVAPGPLQSSFRCTSAATV